LEAAKAEKPSKDEIGGFLETVLRTAREGAGFAGIAAKLAPYVHTVAWWLGGQWTNLATLFT
jgi:hypothetical protein